MRKALAGLIALVVALTLGVTAASAHTGSVTANCTTITFTYNNNFSHTTVVTEKYTVDGGAQVTKNFTVPANTNATDVITFASPGKATFAITAGSTWSDGNAAGSIPTATFNPTGCAVVCVPTEKIVYVDRPTIVYVDKPYPVTTIQYVNRDVPGPEKVVYVTKEVPGPEVVKYVSKEVPGGTVVQYVTKEVPGATTVEYVTVQVPGATTVKTITKYRTRTVNHTKVRTKVIIKLVPKKYPYTK